MYKSIILLFLLNISYVFGQISTFNNSGEIQGIVYFSNGEVKKGELLSFQKNSLVNFNIGDGALSTNPYKNIESALNLFDKQFKIKSGNEKITVNIDEIDSLEIINSRTSKSVFHKLQMVELNSDGEIKDSIGKQTLLPVLRRGSKVNAYGFNIISCYGNGNQCFPEQSFTQFYFRNNNTDYVLRPFDMSIGVLLSKKKRENSLLNTIKVLSYDCPEYHQLIQDKVDEEMSKENNKKLRKEYKKKYKEAKKRINDLPKDDQFDAWLEYYNSVSLDPLYQLFNDYNQMCN